ncbi:MAG TPA: hypothetical protein VJ739_08180 [Gemmataceae bacterium]|nr:hypothetical protein [Gemmataceae bacterium]
MIRRVSLAVVAALVLAAAAPAQTGAWRFHWQAGRVLTYRVEQSTTVTEMLSSGKVECKERLGLTKRWQVLAVDPAGVATLQLSLTALRRETTTPGGEVLFFDSANPDKSEPQVRQQMAQYLNQPIASLRVDDHGRVVEVKESKFGPASTFERDLPFRLILPDTVPQVGQAWERTYQVTVDPPAGTGEKYDAVQRWTCKAASGTSATLAVVAALKTMPAAVGDQAPLLQNQPEGEIVFDVQAGRVQSINLHVDKELKNHQGEGTSVHFQSTYVEQYAGAN